MENVKSLFDSFKEFTWDIVGYLLPGSYVLILLSVCIKQEYFVSTSFGDSTNDFFPFVFIVISYLLGYVAYGFGLFKEKMLGRISYIKRIETKVAKRKTVTLTKELILKALESKGLNGDLESATIRDLRSLAMSFIPEHDQKIYTFTFRSDIANQTGNISLLIGILGIISSYSNSILLHIFKTDLTHEIIYFCLLACYFLLRKTRDKFYEISMGLPFSIYTSNAIKP